MAPFLMAAGTGFQVGGTLAEGKNLEQIAKARADIDRMNAEAAVRRASEAAKIRAEEGRKLVAGQTARFAASGITVGTGSPLVVEAETKADILKDIGFILEQGEVERRGYLSSAALERKMGKMYRRQSLWDAISRGLTGAGSIAYMGERAGWWGKENSNG